MNRTRSTAKARYLAMWAVYALLMTYSGMVEADGSTAEKSQGAPKGEKGTNDSQEKEPTELDPKLVYLPSLRIPVVQNRVLRTYYLLDLRLLAKDPETAALVFKQRPKIMDALFCDLYAILGVSWHPDYHINLAHLKKRMDTVVERVVGKDKIDQVLVQRFTTQKNRSRR